MSFKQALCRMYELSFVILDEVDGYSDDESSHKLYDQIVSDGTFDQMFVISHKKKTCFEILDMEPNSKHFSVHAGQVVQEQNGVYDVD